MRSWKPRSHKKPKIVKYEIEHFMQEVDEFYRDPMMQSKRSFKNSLNIDMVNVKLHQIQKNKQESHF
jgi:hypothetical protein